MEDQSTEQESNGRSHHQVLYPEDFRPHDTHSYFPPEQSRWLNQIEPVPLADFPQSIGPLIHEGYVPNSGSELNTSRNSGRSVYPDLDFLSSNQIGFPEPMAVDSEDDMALAMKPLGDGTAPPVARKTRGSTRGSRRGVARNPPQPRPERKRGRKKGEKRGPREALDPGDEFNALHRQATEAFLDRQDHETALQCILQAISINPEIHSAHVLLSEIYFFRDETDKGFAALFSGAHAAPNDPNVWHQLADACLQRASGDRENMLKQASYCFSRVLNIDQKDLDARFQKASISKELGYYAKALKDLDILLKHMPHNASVLAEVAEVCIDLGDTTRARALYEEALQAQRSADPSGEESFGWAHLIVYVDLLSFSDGTSEAIRVLSEISRSFVGREDETFWNDVGDDREWDADHESRRANTIHFRAGLHPLEAYGSSLPIDLRVKLANLRLTEGMKQEAIQHFEWLDPDARGEGSAVYEYTDLFLQTADSLRNSKEFHEAYRFYSALNDINAYDDIEFWLGIGSCAYACGEKNDAIQYFEKAKALNPDNAEASTQLSKLYTDRGDRTQAVKHALDALAVYENVVGRTSKRRYERKGIRQARHEAQDAYKKAYRLTPPPGERGVQVPAPSFSRRAREKRRRAQRETLEAEQQEQQQDQEANTTPQDPSAKVFKLPKKRLTKAQRTKEQQEANVRDMYVTLCEYTQDMRLGDEEGRSIWLECAEALIEEFRAVKDFYPSERYRTFQGFDSGLSSKKSKKDDAGMETNQEDVPLPTIENTIPDSYGGIPFPVWLDIFLEYALLLANLQYEPAECYSIINAAQDCSIWYHDNAAMTQIYVCYTICALALQDEATLFGVALRWLMREYAYTSDIYRLFSALNFYYPHIADKGGKLGQMANAKFRIPPNQKFLFRHVVSLDGQLPDDYGVGTQYGPVPPFMRKDRHESGYGYLRLSDALNENPDEHQSPRGTQHPAISALDPDSTSGTPLQDQTEPQQPTCIPPTKPTEMEIHMLILYGQILYASGSFPNALSYFYRAMSLSPRNPVLLLTMSLCYIHQMLKRQCENRHMYFLQGLALFERYAEERLSWAEDKMGEAGNEDPNLAGLLDTVRREIEFNRARCWHMVGMADLAIRGYERMIDLRPVKAENEDAMEIDGGVDDKRFSMEAAYSMALIYATNGDAQTAKDITEKWMVVE